MKSPFAFRCWSAIPGLSRKAASAMHSRWISTLRRQCWSWPDLNDPQRCKAARWRVLSKANRCIGDTLSGGTLLRQSMASRGEYVISVSARRALEVHPLQDLHGVDELYGLTSDLYEMKNPLIRLREARWKTHNGNSND